MSVDATPPEPPVPAIEWKLPGVREITIRRGRGEPPPRLEYFSSSVPDLPEVVEFEVVLDGPIPARALPPVLYVGETQVFQRRVGLGGLKGGDAGHDYLQSAMKTLRSFRGSFPFRLEMKTIFVPSGEKQGNPSKPS